MYKNIYLFKQKSMKLAKTYIIWLTKHVFLILPISVRDLNERERERELRYLYAIDMRFLPPDVLFSLNDQ